MIQDRARITNKLKRIQRFIENGPNEIGKWPAVYEVDKLRRAAKYQPDWKWQGFESEVAWARNYLGIAERTA